jgi:membrane protein YqaA with SNARE-associated domain
MTSTLGLFVASKLWIWLRNLGGPGLLLLGLADNSVIPLPGSMDVLTIWFVVHHHKQWYYFVAMATAGAMAGGYITYRLARKGGKEALEHRMGPRATSFCKRFQRWGFWAIFVPALLPPPFPFVPFLLAAGALQYSRKKFIAALGLGRGLRYGILAGLGLLYGRHFLRFFNKYTKPTMYILVALSVIAGAAALWTYVRYRNQAGTAAAQQPAH